MFLSDRNGPNLKNRKIIIMKTIKCFYNAFSYVDILAMEPECYAGQVDDEPWQDPTIPDDREPETHHGFTDTNVTRVQRVFDRFARMGGLKGPNSGEFGVTICIPQNLDEPCTYVYYDAYGGPQGIIIEFPMDKEDRIMINESAKSNYEKYWARFNERRGK